MGIEGECDEWDLCAAWRGMTRTFATTRDVTMVRAGGDENAGKMVVGGKSGTGLFDKP